MTRQGRASIRFPGVHSFSDTILGFSFFYLLRGVLLSYSTFVFPEIGGGNSVLSCPRRTVPLESSAIRGAKNRSALTLPPHPNAPATTLSPNAAARVRALGSVPARGRQRRLHASSRGIWARGGRAGRARGIILGWFGGGDLISSRRRSPSAKISTFVMVSQIKPKVSSISSSVMLRRTDSVRSQSR